MPISNARPFLPLNNANSYLLNLAQSRRLGVDFKEGKIVSLGLGRYLIEQLKDCFSLPSRANSQLLEGKLVEWLSRNGKELSSIDVEALFILANRMGLHLNDPHSQKKHPKLWEQIKPYVEKQMPPLKDSHKNSNIVALLSTISAAIIYRGAIVAYFSQQPNKNASSEDGAIPRQTANHKPIPVDDVVKGPVAPLTEVFRPTEIEVPTDQLQKEDERQSDSEHLTNAVTPYSVVEENNSEKQPMVHSSPEPINQPQLSFASEQKLPTMNDQALLGPGTHNSAIAQLSAFGTWGAIHNLALAFFVVPPVLIFAYNKYKGFKSGQEGSKAFPTNATRDGGQVDLAKPDVASSNRSTDHDEQTPVSTSEVKEGGTTQSLPLPQKSPMHVVDSIQAPVSTTPVRQPGGPSVQKRSPGGSSVQKRSPGSSSVQARSSGGSSVSKGSSGGHSVQKRAPGGSLLAPTNSQTHSIAGKNRKSNRAPQENTRLCILNKISVSEGRDSKLKNELANKKANMINQ